MKLARSSLRRGRFVSSFEARFFRPRPVADHGRPATDETSTAQRDGTLPPGATAFRFPPGFHLATSTDDVAGVFGWVAGARERKTFSRSSGN